MEILSHLRLWKEYLKVNIAGAMEYRFNFLVQSISMFLNDAVWVSFWWILFAKFPQINGWDFKDILLMYAVVTLSYGLAGVLFGNRNKIHVLVAEGGLDFYLTLPKNELFHVLISRSNWFDFGDVIFGLFLAIISLDLIQWPLFLVLVILSMIIFCSFNIIVSSLSFFFGNVDETTRSFNIGFISFASYPLDIFQGVTKILLLTLIPAGFISTIPVKLLQIFDWKWFLIMFWASILLLAIAIFVFRVGLRRYESGNLINVRM